MKTILHVIDTGGSGGAETVFLHTATRLDAARFKSVAVVGGDGWLAARLRERGLNPLVIPAKGSFNIAYLRKLIGVIREYRVDLIAAHLYGSAIYASLAGILCRKPVVSILHGQSDVNPRARLASIKAGIVRYGSGAVIFVSDNLRAELAPKLGVPPGKCLVVPNGVDLEEFSPGKGSSLREALNLPADTALIGSIGNIRAPKAYEILLHAAALIAKRSDRFHFAIAGDCSGKLGEKMYSLRSQLGLERSVTFLGLRADVVELLRNFDVFALSSRTEGFSIACIEAMACGVPIVSTRSGGPQQILEGGCGELVAVDDPLQLADAIERIAWASGKKADMVRAALDRVRQRYSLQGMLRQYDEVFMRLLNERAN